MFMKLSTEFHLQDKNVVLVLTNVAHFLFDPCYFVLVLVKFLLKLRYNIHFNPYFERQMQYSVYSMTNCNMTKFCKDLNKTNTLKNKNGLSVRTKNTEKLRD